MLVAAACWELPLVRPGVCHGRGGGGAGGAGGGDKGSLVHVALGDDAVKGRGDALVGLQGDDAAEVGLEGFHVALRGGDVGALGLVVGLLLVAILAGEDALGDEDSVAVYGDLGEGELGLLLGLLGLGLAELLAGLIDLLVEIGGVDDGEELAFVDVVADVYVTLFEVAVGAGVDGGFGEGRGGSGDDEARTFLCALATRTTSMTGSAFFACLERSAVSLLRLWRGMAPTMRTMMEDDD